MLTEQSWCRHARDRQEHDAVAAEAEKAQAQFKEYERKDVKVQAEPFFKLRTSVAGTGQRSARPQNPAPAQVREDLKHLKEQRTKLQASAVRAATKAKVQAATLSCEEPPLLCSVIHAVCRTMRRLPSRQRRLCRSCRNTSSSSKGSWRTQSRQACQA